MAMPQVFCCSNVDGLKGGAYLVLRVFVVRITRRENVYKAEAREVRSRAKMSRSHTIGSLIHENGSLAVCLSVHLGRIMVKDHFTYKQMAYLFHLQCKRGLIGDSALCTWASERQLPRVLVEVGVTGWTEGSQSGSLAVLGEHKSVILELWIYANPCLDFSRT